MEILLHYILSKEQTTYYERKSWKGKKSTFVRLKKELLKDGSRKERRLRRPAS